MRHNTVDTLVQVRHHCVVEDFVVHWEVVQSAFGGVTVGQIGPRPDDAYHNASGLQYSYSFVRETHVVDDYAVSSVY